MDEKSLGQLLIIWNVMSGDLLQLQKPSFYSRFGIESKRGKVTQEVYPKSQRIDRFLVRHYNLPLMLVASLLLLVKKSRVVHTTPDLHTFKL